MFFCELLQHFEFGNGESLLQYPIVHSILRHSACCIFHALVTNRCVLKDTRVQESLFIQYIHHNNLLQQQTKIRDIHFLRTEGCFILRRNEHMRLSQFLQNQGSIQDIKLYITILCCCHKTCYM